MCAEGGAELITIQFSDIEDCVSIYEHLYNALQTHRLENINVKKRKDRRLLVWSDDEQVSVQAVMRPLIARVLTNYIVQTYEKKWIHELLETKFHYSDVEERNALMLITCSIMDGKKPDLPQMNHLPSRKRLIEEAIIDLLREGVSGLSFRFDSFLQFRLKTYRECLLTYVEMAIDEYKLEQDYQNLIENLRAFVDRKKPVIQKILVVYDKKPMFFDKDFTRIDDEKIQHAVRSSYLFLGNTVIEPLLLQPLLALAPSRIELYTKVEEFGILYTLKNIFQERLSVYSLEMIPDLSELSDSVEKEQS